MHHESAYYYIRVIYYKGGSGDVTEQYHVQKQIMEY